MEMMLEGKVGSNSPRLIVAEKTLSMLKAVLQAAGIQLSCLTFST